MRTDKLLTIGVLLAVATTAGCSGVESLAPRVEPQISVHEPGPKVPVSPRHNRITFDSSYTFADAGINSEPDSVGSVDEVNYEMRFGFNGYSTAHVEPWYTWHSSDPLPTPLRRIGALMARPRLGSNDYISLYACVRRFIIYTTIYNDCQGGSYLWDDHLHAYLEDEVRFYPEDNGREKAVAVSAWKSSGGSGQGSASFRVKLSWTPVSIHPATVTVTSPAATSAGLFLNVAGQGTELIAKAHDANGQDIPGLPISWSSSDPSVVGVAENGWIWPVAPGTAYVTAMVSGVSGTRRVTVTSDLSVDIFGPTTMRPNESCTFTARTTSTDFVDPLTYSWRGPGGATGVGEQYVAPASATTYNLTLTTTDATGRTGSKTKTIRAAASNPSCRQFQQ